jgi:hypothetical protein
VLSFFHVQKARSALLKEDGFFAPAPIALSTPDSLFLTVLNDYSDP